MNTSRKRRSALMVAGSLVATTTGYALVAGSAEAVPGAQERCSFGHRSVTVDDGWKPLGLQVRISNGSRSRKVVARLAADLGVDSAAEIRVGYSIDGGPVRERVYGPANLANHAEFWETRSTMAVIPLSAGSHTVTPYWRVSGAAGKTGQFGGGCFTLEGRTR